MGTNRPAITDISALEIIDNRGRPTIRARVYTDAGCCGRADVPCGSSTGSYEAFDLRDGDARYGGRGVRRAIANIHDVLRPALVGQDVTDQRGLDQLMLDLDGTPNKSRLGGNALLAVSMAAAQAAAASLRLPLYRYLSADGHVLPVPQSCLINGGVHAGNDLDAQEFCVMPVGSPTFAEATRLVCEVFETLKGLLQRKHGKLATNFGEDGGYAPPLRTSREAMDLLCEAVTQTGCVGDVVYGLDIAATPLYDSASGTYRFDGRSRTPEEMIAAVLDLVREYPSIVSVEDPLQQDDLAGWKVVVDSLPGVLVVGDDLTATNLGRLRLAVGAGAMNALLCKVNQAGTVTECMDAARFAQRHTCPVVMSPRSGETEDDILSDISVALNAGAFKIGGPHGSDRGANFNRFLEIEAELGPVGSYAGRDFAQLA
ncbi:MAG: phosphopyruvate hydratase [Dehalococcoidia bacterium]|jgi:enolase|nr:phosphopyruvate hydratase [Dehalococcoidia bacterium]